MAAFVARTKRRLGARVAGLVVLCALTGACSGPDFAYLKSAEVEGSRATAFFKLPEDWARVDVNDLVDQMDELPPEVSEQLGSQWSLFFDASPRPSPDHMLTPVTDYPAGRVSVRTLEPNEDYSVLALRNEIIDYEALRSSDGFRLEEYEELTFPEGMEGLRFQFEFVGGENPVTVGQVGAFDEEQRTAYTFFVSCKSACFEKYERTIDEMMESYTVEDVL
jgi:hypothetical protein